MQSAIQLGDSEPEPDITLARGDDFTFAIRHPEAKDVGVATEVSDSTLTRDRNDKGRIYARAGVPVYWIVNLQDQQIEVYTDPVRTGADAKYSQRQDYRSGDKLPLVLDGLQIAEIAVNEILG